MVQNISDCVGTNTAKRARWTSLQTRTVSELVLSMLGKNLRATDPKDHIYGLLALTKISIVPDYKETTTLSDVLCQYVTARLESQASIHTELSAIEDEKLKVFLGGPLF